MPLPLGVAIGAGVAQIGSSIWNSIRRRKQSQRNQDRTIEANKEMAKYAYSKDLEMWNRQNQYNNPVNQMQRLQSAGLNPNLVYGTGTVAGNTSGQMPKYNAPRIDYNEQALQMPEGSQLAQFQNLQMQSAQIDNVKAQTQSLQQGTINKGIQETILAFKAKIGAWNVNTKSRWHKGREEWQFFGWDKNAPAYKKAHAEANSAVSQKEFMAWKAQLAQSGLDTNDNVALRILVHEMQLNGLTISDVTKLLVNQIKEGFTR